MKYLFSVVLLTFLFSCHSETRDKKKNEQIENDVLSLMKKIERSDKKSLRNLLIKFTDFSNQVSGDIKSTYSGFAFNYPQENPDKFFSTLHQTDKKIIDKWVKTSVDELKLVLDNVDNPKKFFRHFKKDLNKKLQRLGHKEQELGGYYLKKLNALK